VTEQNKFVSCVDDPNNPLIDQCQCNPGFSGTATPEDKCRCESTLKWMNGVPQCV
jgi:hypothetical protein